MVNCRRVGATTKGQEDGTQGKLAGAGMADRTE